MSRILVGLAVVMGLCILCSSCGNTRQITYMQGAFDTAKLSQLKIPEPIIRKGDVLSIIVYSDNPTSTAIYNQSLIINSGASSASGGASTEGNSSSVAGTSPTTSGYQVDENGNITFQGLGLLHVEGLTKSTLKDTLDGRLKQFLKNPYYSIRFLNYRFTILGEINRPGIYSIPGEQVSLLQALGMSGDITFYGRRDNILVMRESNGKREFARLDITKPEVLASPFYYLQQNDMVIVDPTRKKVVASDQVTSRNVTIAASIVSTLAIIYSIFRK